MCRPTRQGYRGRLIWLGARAKITPSRCAGVVAAACTQGKRTQHGKPQGVVSDDQPDAREGQVGRHGVAERFAVPLKPGNAGGGKPERSMATLTWQRHICTSAAVADRVPARKNGILNLSGGERDHDVSILITVGGGGLDG